MSDWLRFLLAALAVWRLTHLLAREDGPSGVIATLRERLGDGFWGQLMDCPKCLSMWLAVPFVPFVGEGLVESLVSWLALSAVAVLLEERMGQPLLIDEGEDDELLR
jgi:hypothetical protein